MKKYVIMLVLALTSLNGFAQDTIKWMSFEEALEAQKTEPRKIFMDVYTEWCGPCKMLDKNTFQNQDVAAYINENFYAVKFNAEGTEEVTYNDFTYTNPSYDPNREGRNSQHLLASAMNINGYPSIVFFDEQGKFIQPIPGYKTPQEIELFLKIMNTDDFKKITTEEEWIAYQENFKSEFKE